MATTELSKLERAEQIDEWLKLLEEETSAQLAQKTGPGRPESGVSVAARELGIDRDAARSAQAIASLQAEVKSAAQELGLGNNQSALSAAADPITSLEKYAKRRHPPEELREEKAARERRKFPADDGENSSSWRCSTSPVIRDGESVKRPHNQGRIPLLLS
jgi:hypothetical protein